MRAVSFGDCGEAGGGAGLMNSFRAGGARARLISREPLLHG